MCADAARVPVIFGDDDDGDYFGRLIKGTRLKFIDKVWTATDGTPLHENDQFLVAGTGPFNINVGSSPILAVATTRARGFRPCVRA